MRCAALAILVAWVCACDEESTEPATPQVVTEATDPEEPSELGEESSEPAEAVAAVTPVSSPQLRIGGVLIPLGLQNVEVFPRPDGSVEAVVLDPQGRVVVGGEDTTLALQMSGADEQRHPVVLQWQAGVNRYGGAVGGDAQLLGGPVDVTLTTAGAAQTGRAENVELAPAARRGGTVMLLGELAAEVVVDTEGAVTATLYDQQGELIAGESGTVVVGHVTGADSQPLPVGLTWDEGEEHYAGAAGQTASAGPLGLTVTRAGQELRGRISPIAIAPTPSHGGQVLVVGDHVVELVRRSGGGVEAYITDSTGAALGEEAGAGAGLELDPIGETDAESVELAWDSDASAYRGVLSRGVDWGRTLVHVRLTREAAVRHGGISGLPAPRGDEDDEDRDVVMRGPNMSSVRVSSGMSPGIDVDLGMGRTAMIGLGL